MPFIDSFVHFSQPLQKSMDTMQIQCNSGIFSFYFSDMLVALLFWALLILDIVIYGIQFDLSIINFYLGLQKIYILNICIWDWDFIAAIYEKCPLIGI